MKAVKSMMYNGLFGDELTQKELSNDLTPLLPATPSQESAPINKEEVDIAKDLEELGISKELISQVPPELPSLALFVKQSFDNHPIFAILALRSVTAIGKHILKNLFFNSNKKRG